MKRRKQILVLVVLCVSFFSPRAFAQLHLDTDTGKMIRDGFDVKVYADLPEAGMNRFAFGRGGGFGNDMYVTVYTGKVYRVTSSGQVSLFAQASTDQAITPCTRSQRTAPKRLS